MFRHRKQLHRWVARALLVWLFGVATGVAQACLMSGSLPSGGPQFEPAVAEQGPAPEDESRPVQDGGCSGHDGTLVKSNCQDLCEKSAAATPLLKSDLAKVQGHALPPAQVAIAGPVPSAASVPLPTPRRDRALPLPVRLAFPRLAL